MKYYKLTLLKDLPEGKAGYTKSFKEELLTDRYAIYGWMPIDYKLRELQDNEEWVKKEIDEEMAIPELICPECGHAALFFEVGPELRSYDDGVNYYYKVVNIECGYCGRVIGSTMVDTHHKIVD